MLLGILKGVMPQEAVQTVKKRLPRHFGHRIPTREYQRRDPANTTAPTRIATPMNTSDTGWDVLNDMPTMAKSHDPNIKTTALRFFRSSCLRMVMSFTL